MSGQRFALRLGPAAAPGHTVDHLHVCGPEPGRRVGGLVGGGARAGEVALADQAVHKHEPGPERLARVRLGQSGDCAKRLARGRNRLVEITGALVRGREVAEYFGPCGRRGGVERPQIDGAHLVEPALHRVDGADVVGEPEPRVEIDGLFVVLRRAVPADTAFGLDFPLVHLVGTGPRPFPLGDRNANLSLRAPRERAVDQAGKETRLGRVLVGDDHAFHPDPRLLESPLAQVDARQPEPGRDVPRAFAELDDCVELFPRLVEPALLDANEREVESQVGIPPLL